MLLALGDEEGLEGPRPLPTVAVLLAVPFRAQGGGADVSKAPVQGGSEQSLERFRRALPGKQDLKARLVININ